MAKNQKLSVGFLFDDTLDSNDGVAQHVKTVGAWLSRQGHEVSYLVGETKLTDWAGGKIYSLARNQTVYFNGNKLSIPWLSNKKRIKQVLSGHRFDVLHVMVPYSPFMSQRVINKAGPATAIVGTFHIFPSGVLSRFGSRLLRLLYGRSLKKISPIVSVSQPAADFAKKAYGLSSSIIPNPVDINNFTHASSGSSEAKSMRIVFLGRLVKRKGAQQLIEAFGLVSRHLPQARLVIAGDGGNRHKLERLAEKLRISDKVEFLGYIDESAKAELLASADVACFPSLYGESFGIVLVEAMAAGAGVVLAGDNPGYRSILEKQPLLLINPLNKAGFAARLQKLLTDDTLRRELHAWQASQIDQYDINAVGPQILKLYQTAIARLAKNSHNKSHG
jgi:phosphatidyl-myo-inositol alpha-mannosyltransferase